MSNRRFLPALLSAVLLPLALLLGAMGISGSEDERQLELLRRSVSRCAVQCYAIEGAYPPSLEYMLRNYGLAVDTERYFVDYRYIASNLMPDIAVLEREG
ncbi:MAG: hypothetical protein ACOX81_03450 [Candidatus Heteroscillospira sp.]|jgi:hypothetical protein